MRPGPPGTSPQPSPAVQRGGLAGASGPPHDVGVETTAQRRLRDRRRDDVDRVLADAGARIPHPDLAARAAFAGLRARLAEVHAHCEHVEEHRWADYRARLDAGLSELAAERARAVEDGGAPEDTLFPLVARLELHGWRVRLAAAAGHRAATPDPAPIEPLIAYVDHELDTYQRPGGATPERRDHIRHVLDTVAARAADPPP